MNACNTNTLGTKTFGRSILALVCIDQDFRTDEEFARSVQLPYAETVKRAKAWAYEVRKTWTLVFDTVAISEPTFVAPVSGAWPLDDKFEMNGKEYVITHGARKSGNYLAIY
jgi:hypothetical protein